MPLITTRFDFPSKRGRRSRRGWDCRRREIGGAEETVEERVSEEIHRHTVDAYARGHYLAYGINLCKDLDSDDKNCPICYEPFIIATDGDPAKEMEFDLKDSKWGLRGINTTIEDHTAVTTNHCSHIFHIRFLDESLKHNNVCPMCRTVLVGPDANPLQSIQWYYDRRIGELRLWELHPRFMFTVRVIK